MEFLKMIVSSPAYLGTCIKLIKLTGSAAEFKTTQILLFLESGSPEAQTSSYSPCLPSTSQYFPAEHLFYRIYVYLTVHSKNAFRNRLCVPDTVLLPCPQQMAWILVNNSVQTLLRQEGYVHPQGLLTEFSLASVPCEYSRWDKQHSLSIYW